jgi:hypothetical protein
MARPPAAELARAFGGFVLGALLSVFLPPLAFAMALVLAGVIVWARLRHEDVSPVTALAVGFLLAVAAYLVLLVLSLLA